MPRRQLQALEGPGGMAHFTLRYKRGCLCQPSFVRLDFPPWGGHRTTGTFQKPMPLAVVKQAHSLEQIVFAGVATPLEICNNIRSSTYRSF